MRGAAHPLERTRPFGPLVDALDLRPASADTRRAAIGELLVSDAAVRAGVPAAGQLLFRAVEEMIDLIEVLPDQEPVLVALDDLHWADGSTLLAFEWMLRRLTEVPVLLVATLRPSPRGSELAQLLDDARRLGATLIELKPLDEQQVIALVQSELGLAPGHALAAALQRAGGNPLWVVELLRSLSAEGMLDLSGTARSWLAASYQHRFASRFCAASVICRRGPSHCCGSPRCWAMSSRCGTWRRSPAGVPPTSSRSWGRRSAPADQAFLLAQSSLAGRSRATSPGESLLHGGRSGSPSRSAIPQ